MVGLPWSQHVAFLDDRALHAAHPPRASSARRGRARRSSGGRCSSRSATRSRQASCAGTAACASSASCATCTTSQGRVARQPVHLRELPADRIPRPARSSTSARSTSTCTARPELRAYLARLQHVAGPQAAAAGRSGRRQHPRGRGRARRAITAMHVRAAFEEGACGAIAFAWTDEWWRGGHPVEDWAFGLVDARSRAEAGGRGRGRRRSTQAPFPEEAPTRLAARLGRRLRLQRGRHARRLPDVARARSRTPTTRSSSSTTARAIAPARSRAPTRACA